MALASPWLALLLLTAVVVLWVAVDAAWRRTVQEGGDPSAHEGRISCGGCQGGGCTNQCGRESATGSEAAGRER
jgi:hypothetical protein